MTYTIEDIEGEVSRALRQLDDCRNNYSPTEFFDDLMARAAGALIHQQELLRRQHADINELHHAIKDAGWHPGRTDDKLTDVIREKGELLRRQHAAIRVLREALIEMSGMYVVHHDAAIRAKKALRDTEEFQ